MYTPSNAKNADFDHVLTVFSKKIQDAAQSSWSDEARYVTNIPYHEWRRYVTKIFLLYSVAIRGTLCNNIVAYRSANGNDM
jgi:hypothetical protein